MRWLLVPSLIITGVISTVLARFAWVPRAASGAARKGKQENSTGHENEVIYRSLIESFPDAILITTTDGQVLECNPAACQMIGYSKEEFFNLFMGDLISQKAANIPNESILDLTPSQISSEISPDALARRKDGTTFPIELRKRPLGLAGGQLLIHFIQDISEREKADQAQREQAKTLREVTGILNISLDQPQVLQLILEQLARVVEYDSASLMLYDGQLLSNVAHHNLRSKNQEFHALDVRLLPHVQEVLEQLHPVIIADTTLDPRWIFFPGGTYIRSWMGVPLIGKDRVIGLLNLDKEQAGFYHQQDTELALVFANHAASAIENARLYAAERRRVDELDALRATVADISAELELPKLLQAVLERAVSLLNATGGDLGLYDEARKEILIVVSHNMGKDYAGTRMGMGEGAMGQVAETCSPLVISNYVQWEDRSPQYTEGNWQALVATPLLIGGRLLGAIGIVDSDPERKFTLSDERLLSLFAQQAAIAVENARLYQSAREAAERRAVLHEVSQQIVAASLEPEDIYTAIHKAAAQLMPAEAFVITLLDEANQMIEAVYLIDRAGRARGERIPANCGLSGQVIASGISLCIKDVLEETGSRAGMPLDSVHFGDDEEVRSVLAVPMHLGGKVIGMLSAQSYQPYTYTPEDQYLLEMLAAYAAIALENALLFGEVQRLAITDSITGIFNHRHLFELARREFTRARRFGRPLSMIMLDIDHFKPVNDTYGHPTGDQVLHSLAHFLQGKIREVDILARYGGEEFTIILPETDLAAAYLLAERLRKEVAAQAFATDKADIRITISIGVTTLTEETPDLAALVSCVDSAMYDAKHDGRNRVAIR